MLMCAAPMQARLRYLPTPRNSGILTLPFSFVWPSFYPYRRCHLCMSQLTISPTFLHSRALSTHQDLACRYLIPSSHMLVLATNEQFLPAWSIFRAILASESHWLQPMLILSVHWWPAPARVPMSGENWYLV